MLVSICLLGYGAVAKEVYSRLKSMPGYGTEWRLHTIYVPNKDKYPDVKQNSEWQWKIDDETFNTELETSIGDDLDWLLASDGHDTVVDCTPYTPESFSLISKLLAKGYWLHTCSKGLVQFKWQELVEIARASKSKIYFNSIPSSDQPTEYDSIGLTHENWWQYADDPDMFIYRGGGPEETAEIIVKDIAKEIDRRREIKRIFDSLSPEEQQRIEKETRDNDSNI